MHSGPNGIGKVGELTMKTTAKLTLTANHLLTVLRERYPMIRKGARLSVKKSGAVQINWKQQWPH